MIALKGFVDADKVLTSLILIPTNRTFQYVEQSVNNVIMLKTYVSSIIFVYKALATAQSDPPLTMREVFFDIEVPMSKEVGLLIPTAICPRRPSFDSTTHRRDHE